MIVQWSGRPSGYRNIGSEVDEGTSGDYYFSLCQRTAEDDIFPFRVWAYRAFKGGYLLVGRGQSADECREQVATWEDPDPDDQGFGFRRVAAREDNE